MVAKFDQWPAKPSTLRFLRSLLTSGDARARLPFCHSKQQRKCGTIRWSSTYKPFVSLREVDEDQGNEENEKPDEKSLTSDSPEVLSPLPYGTLDVEKLSFQLSLAGVVVLTKDIIANNSFPELRRQADVNSDQAVGKLLVDEPANKDNAKLWAEILQFRQRVDGLPGVVDVWRGMHKREIDLPVQGEEAGILWMTFIRATLSKKEDENVRQWTLLSEIFDYAVRLKARTDRHYEGLYKCIVGSLLRSNFSRAARNVQAWSRKLSDAGFRSREDVARIVEDALKSPHRSKALNSLKAIYLTCGHRDLYDLCIGEALVVGDEAAALALHQLFIDKGDEPSPAMSATPEVQRLFELDQDESLPLKSLSDGRAGMQSKELASVQEQLARIREAPLPRMFDDTPGIKDRKLSDHFCTRLIATRAFSLNFVIQALSMLGVEQLGPLAMREMAVRTRSPIELSSTLKDVEAHSMKFTDHVYCQLVSKIAAENITALWDVLLASDQHPESYSDSVTQEALLVMFLQKHQWAEAHLSLIALSLAGRSGSIQGWNVVLQHYLQNYEYRPMLHTFESMQSQSILLSPNSVYYIFWNVLPERAPGKRYVKGRTMQFFDQLNFVVKALMYASEQGTRVDRKMWRELLKRLGMNHQWDDVERLVLWLMDHYSFEKSARMLGLSRDFYLHRKRILRRASTIPEIFDVQMRNALVAWGFRSASVRGQLKIMLPDEDDMEARDVTASKPAHEPWAQGLALLKTLSERDPIFDLRNARKAFRLRMWILFGPAYSTLGLNNEAKRGNSLSLRHYIRHADEVWPGMARGLNSSLLQDAIGYPRLLFFAFFGAFRRVSRKRREYVDIAAWLQQHSQAWKSRDFAERRSIPAKQAMWQRFGFPIRRIILLKKDTNGQIVRDPPNGRRPLAHRSRVVRLRSLNPPPSPLYNLEQT